MARLVSVFVVLSALLVGKCYAEPDLFKNVKQEVTSEVNRTVVEQVNDMSISQLRQSLILSRSDAPVIETIDQLNAEQKVSWWDRTKQLTSKVVDGAGKIKSSGRAALLKVAGPSKNEKQLVLIDKQWNKINELTDQIEAMDGEIMTLRYQLCTVDTSFNTCN